ncbi:unnamed protein product [Polarella glacialis]|uniref:Protein HIRA n=1 Tax=Polarella glacialis TaxID=89957 RepID=A0A813FFD9_POLGL|nr:unnamed protein product [Polarella glacialis]
MFAALEQGKGWSLLKRKKTGQDGLESVDLDDNTAETAPGPGQFEDGVTEEALPEEKALPEAKAPLPAASATVPSTPVTPPGKRPSSALPGLTPQQSPKLKLKAAAPASAASSAAPLLKQVGAKLQKIAGLDHRDTSILSIDFAPPSETSLFQVSGSWRLVTAGQDCAVKVWSIEVPALVGPTPCSCKWLATMSEHSSAVNCARWSPDFGMIASCDADAALIVWAPGAGGLQAFRASEKSGPEPWHRKWLLRGHRGEICDLAWHPNLHPKFALASCSHDGCIRLWNVAQGESTAVLQTPEGGLIKGISFDPLGQYLATMSDVLGVSNRTRAGLWECPDEDGAVWRQVHVGQEPWNKPCHLGTAVYFRRPSWDPLGQSIIFPYGEYLRSEASTPRFFAAMFAREAWATPRLYKGHSQRVAVARFCPVVFGPPGELEKAAVALALGSQDGTLSIWMSHHPMPLCVLSELVDENCIITDIAWAPDGSSLALTSNDGKACLVNFVWDELMSGLEGSWSGLDVRRWCCQRQLEVFQPSWDLPLQPSRQLGLDVPRPNAEDLPPPQAKRRRPRNLAGLEAWSIGRDKGYADLSGGPTWSEAQECQPAASEQMVGSVTLKDATGMQELIIEPVVSPVGRLCRVRAWNLGDAAVNRGGGSTSSTSSAGGRIRPSWQVALDGQVIKSSLCGGMAVLALEDELPVAVRTNTIRWMLYFLDAASGRHLHPPMQLSERPGRLQLVDSGSSLMLIGSSSGRLSVSHFDSDGKGSCRGMGQSVSEIPVPPTARQPDSMGLVPNASRAPYLLGSDFAIVYHRDLCCWLAVDTWRHSMSLLNFQHTLPCPGHEAGQVHHLTELLRRWRPRPCSELLWSVLADEEDLGYRVHLDRVAQLSHELAVMGLLGSQEEMQRARHELSAYSSEVEADDVEDDFNGADGKAGASPASGSFGDGAAKLASESGGGGSADVKEGLLLSEPPSAGLLQEQEWKPRTHYSPQKK